jgi:hypothetical protein
MPGGVGGVASRDVPLSRLTVAVRGVTLNLGRDEETAPRVEQRNYARCQTFLQNSPDATRICRAAG